MTVGGPRTWTYRRRMPRARKQLVCADETPYYHVSSRCVRRAFLCGVDHYSGRSYEHRRVWIEQRARVLASVFSIELCAYAVMSNNYHLVLNLTPDEATEWSDDEVLKRWTVLYRGTLLVQRYCDGESLLEVELQALRSTAAVYRRRLADLSWFMKCLNEPIARRANREDSCTGHFWESRFYSQALRSERALLAAMAYVDLNPVRAGMTERPEDAEFTSLAARLRGKDADERLDASFNEALSAGEYLHDRLSLRSLMPFSDAWRNRGNSSLPIREGEYVKLVDMTGRVATRGKRGSVDPTLAPVLERLKISADDWIEASSDFRRSYRRGDLKHSA